MAVGDITYITDKNFVDTSIDTEELIRTNIDNDYETRINNITPILNNLHNNNTISSVVGIQQYLGNVKSNMETSLGEILLSSQYMSSNELMNLYPNIPSNNIKTIYYTNFVNMTNSVGKKLKTFLDSISTLSMDLNENTKYQRLLKLHTTDLPTLTHKIDNIVANVNSNNDTFIELVNQIKNIKKDSVAQVMINTQTKIDNLSDLVQQKATLTRYQDSVSKKYYRLYIDDGRVSLREDYAPGSILFGLVCSATLFFASYGTTVIPDIDILEEKLNLYKEFVHVVYDDAIYMVKNNYIYMYDVNTYKLISKVSYDYIYDFSSHDAVTVTNSRILNDSLSVINNSCIYDDQVSDRGYNNTFYIMKSDDSKILFLGDTQKARIACLNLEKWKDDIKQYRLNKGSTSIFRDSNYHLDELNITKIFLFQNQNHVTNIINSISSPSNTDNVVSLTSGRLNLQALDTSYYDLNYDINGDAEPYENELNYLTAITSMDYNSKNKTLFVTLGGINITLSYSLNIGKEEIFLDGESMINYTSGYTYDYFFRFGINKEEQNKIGVRSIKYDDSSKRIYMSGYIDESLDESLVAIPKIKHFIGYANSLNDVKSIVQVYSTQNRPFTIMNNLCLLSVENIIDNNTTYQEFIMHSKPTGHLFSQYFWKNTKYDHDKSLKPITEGYIMADTSLYSGYASSDIYKDYRLTSAEIPTIYIESYSANNASYYLDENIVMYDSSRYMIILEKVMVLDQARYNNAYKNAVKIYDKFNNFYAYDSSDLEKFPDSIIGQRRSQTFIDNLSFLDNYKPSFPDPETMIDAKISYSNKISGYSEFNIINIKVKTLNTSMIDIDFITESSLARLQTNVELVPISQSIIVLSCKQYLINNVNYFAGGPDYRYTSKYLVKNYDTLMLKYNEMSQRRNIFTLNCRLTPTLS